AGPDALRAGVRGVLRGRVGNRDARDGPVRHPARHRLPRRLAEPPDREARHPAHAHRAPEHRRRRRGRAGAAPGGTPPRAARGSALGLARGPHRARASARRARRRARASRGGGRLAPRGGARLGARGVSRMRPPWWLAPAALAGSWLARALAATWRYE